MSDELWKVFVPVLVTVVLQNGSSLISEGTIGLSLASPLLEGQVPVSSVEPSQSLSLPSQISVVGETVCLQVRLPLVQ